MASENVLRDYRENGFWIGERSEESRVWAASVLKGAQQFETDHSREESSTDKRFNRDDFPCPFPQHIGLLALLRDLNIAIPDGGDLTCQLSVIFPGYEKKYFGAHVDGAAKVDEISTFHQVLVGMLLTDLTDSNQGNPIVFEKSHMRIANEFANLPTSTSETELAKKIWDAPHLMKSPGFPERQIFERAGTPFLYSHFLCHGIAPNKSKQKRCAIYFRLPKVGMTCPNQIISLAKNVVANPTSRECKASLA